MEHERLAKALADEGVAVTFGEDGRLLCAVVTMFNNRGDVDRLVAGGAGMGTRSSPRCTSTPAPFTSPVVRRGGKSPGTPARLAILDHGETRQTSTPTHGAGHRDDSLLEGGHDDRAQAIRARQPKP